jgi:hypothetical protein
MIIFVKMKKPFSIYLLLILLFLTAQPVWTQQAEVAVARTVKVSGTPSSEPFLNQLKQRVEAVYDQIVTRLKSTEDVRFVKEYNPSTTNFILRMVFHAFFETTVVDVDENHDYLKGRFRIEVYFKLYDPHTNVLVAIKEYTMTINSDDGITEDEVLETFWEGFEQNGLKKVQGSELEKYIKPKISNINGKINFETKNGSKPKADGKQISTVSVELSKSIRLGESKNNSILTFKLRCKKGLFLKTHSKEIKFTAADYLFEGYGGKNTFQVDYQSFDCKKYSGDEKYKEQFDLSLVKVMNEETERPLAVKEVSFECTPHYDVHAYYNAPGFVKVAVEWKNAEVKFPKEGEKPMVINFADLDLQHSTETELYNKQGERIDLSIPFTLNYPGERRTVYGGPGDDPPKVLYATSLGGMNIYNKFFVQLNDGLNRCELTRVNGGPIYLDFSIDLRCGMGPNKENYDQNVIDCWDPASVKKIGGAMGQNPYPVDFGPILITEEDIAKFEENKPVEKTIQNKGATLKIEFKPSGNPEL